MKSSTQDEQSKQPDNIWEFERFKYMTDFDLLDCQPWQMTRSLFGKKDHSRMQNLAKIKELRQRTHRGKTEADGADKSKADLFDSIIEHFEKERDSLNDLSVLEKS